MKIARLASITVLAVAAICVVVVADAAAAPEFKPSTKTLFQGTGQTPFLRIAHYDVKIACEKVTSTGEIVNATLAGNVVLHYLECDGIEEGKGPCTIKSPGAVSEGLVFTRTLHGRLGLVLPKPASGSDVSLVLAPASGREFALLTGSCFRQNYEVTGSLAGLVEPVGVHQTTDKLRFALTGGQQNIRTVDLSSGGLVLPQLTAAFFELTQEAVEEVTFATAVEVT